MITPINGHILIEPLTHEGFISSQKETYEEIGTVIAISPSTTRDSMFEEYPDVGDKVYFDSWMAAKYPKDDNEDEFYWLVKYQDLRAIEKVSE